MAEASNPAARRGRGLWIALALSLTLNVFVIGGLGWSMMAAPPRPQSAPVRLVAAARKLDLSADQRTALRQFATTARELARGLREDNAPLMRAMWAEIEKPQSDQAVISRLADQTLENRRAYQRKMAANLIGFVATLSPDQRRQFAALAGPRLKPGNGRAPRPNP